MDISLAGLTLHVEDVERSRDFYMRIPGAVLLQHRPGEFALLQFGAGRLGLLTNRYVGGAGGPGFHVELSASLAGVDSVYEQVRANGIEPQEAPTDRSWGERTFHVSDPDGNLIEFDSRL